MSSKPRNKAEETPHECQYCDWGQTPDPDKPGNVICPKYGDTTIPKDKGQDCQYWSDVKKRMYETKE